MCGCREDQVLTLYALTLYIYFGPTEESKLGGHEMDYVAFDIWCVIVQYYLVYAL